MNRMHRSFLTLWVSWILALSAIPRGSAASDFDRGLEAFSAGRFAEAAGLFEKDMTNGRPSLGGLYNLGNARFRNGEIGKAVAAWRLAEHADPSDSAVRQNLRLARRQVQGDGAPDWATWSRRFPPGRFAVLGAVATWVWCGLLLVVRVRRTVPARLRRWAAAGGVATVVLLILYSVALAAWRAAPDAVVVVRDAPVRFGPVDESPVAFLLPDGAEVRVDEERGGWLRVVDGRGQAGWTASVNLVRIPD